MRPLLRCTVLYVLCSQHLSYFGPCSHQLHYMSHAAVFRNEGPVSVFNCCRLYSKVIAKWHPLRTACGLLGLCARRKSRVSLASPIRVLLENWTLFLSLLLLFQSARSHGRQEPLATGHTPSETIIITLGSLLEGIDSSLVQLYPEQECVCVLSSFGINTSSFELAALEIRA